MNDEIKISVIVPAYNLEKCLQATVESILSQTHKNLEIIIVNDGSADGTRDVIEKLAAADERIVPVNKENGGVTSARLEGIRIAKGDFIGFVDGDDLIDSDMYERLLDNAIKYNADISHCGYKKVFADKVDYYYNSGNSVVQDNESGLKDLLSGSFIEPGLWNKLFRKTLFKIFLEKDLIDKKIKNYEDLLMNYYLFKQAKVSVYEDFCPYHYIVREGST
ncbi:MAG: glycosyltransferase, partial [Clostridia bacterium]|nr:glycosyltransferase [Clostridia bacterium]